MRCSLGRPVLQGAARRLTPACRPLARTRAPAWTRIPATCASAPKASWASSAESVRAGRDWGGSQGACRHPHNVFAGGGKWQLLQGGRQVQGRGRRGPCPLATPPHGGSFLSPWQEPPKTTVSAETAAGAWGPTPPSASAPRASSGSSANLVGARAGAGGTLLPCLLVSPGFKWWLGLGLVQVRDQWPRDLCRHPKRGPASQVPEPGHPARSLGPAQPDPGQGQRSQKRLTGGFLASPQKSQPRPAT